MIPYIGSLITGSKYKDVVNEIHNGGIHEWLITLGY